MRLSLLILFTVSLFSAVAVRAQTPNDVLNILVNKGTITQQEADSIRADYVAQATGCPCEGQELSAWLQPVAAMSGYTQVRYNSFQQKGKADGFDIRRARLDFQGDFTKKWGYRLLIDFVGNSGANGTGATGGALVSAHPGRLRRLQARRLSEDHGRPVHHPVLVQALPRTGCWKRPTVRRS